MAAFVPITGLSLPFKPQVPVTPPPDCQSFPSHTSAPFSPHRLNAFKQEVFGVIEAKVEAAATMPTTTVKAAAAAAAAMAANMPGSVCQGNDVHLDKTEMGTGPLDPRYLAMVSRIAAYYQQRCQAVSNYQHQRCQAWANMQRQKCQEMSQAAMLVVAWYVRDRIQRRRKRQKRQFRRGLAERTTAVVDGGAGVRKAKKNETVHKWVTQITDGALPPNGAAALVKPSDTEELEFSMDMEPPPDKDAKLYAVADNLIKSQLARIDVPLMGAISFDDEESESETESETEEMNRWRPQDEDPEPKPKPISKDDVAGPQRERDGDDEEDVDDDDDDEDYSYSYEDDDMEDYDDDNASALVQKGTGSPKGTASLLPS